LTAGQAGVAKWSALLRSSCTWAHSAGGDHSPWCRHRQRQRNVALIKFPRKACTPPGQPRLQRAAPSLQGRATHRNHPGPCSSLHNKQGRAGQGRAGQGSRSANQARGRGTADRRSPTGRRRTRLCPRASGKPSPLCACVALVQQPCVAGCGCVHGRDQISRNSRWRPRAGRQCDHAMCCMPHSSSRPPASRPADRLRGAWLDAAPSSARRQRCNGEAQGMNSTHSRPAMIAPRADAGTV
jgi:hypothetical protein